MVIFVSNTRSLSALSRVSHNARIMLMRFSGSGHQELARTLEYCLKLNGSLLDKLTLYAVEKSETF